MGEQLNGTQALHDMHTRTNFGLWTSNTLVLTAEDGIRRYVGTIVVTPSSIASKFYSDVVIFAIFPELSLSFIDISPLQFPEDFNYTPLTQDDHKRSC